MNKKLWEASLSIKKKSNLFKFEKFISKSILTVSCHSGYTVQICGSNFTHYVDIINKNVSEKELKKKIRATNTKNFKPYLILHNKKARK